MSTPYDITNWAVSEFAEADLGDEQGTKRLSSTAYRKLLTG
jgi:hypothetical protein